MADLTVLMMPAGILIVCLQLVNGLDFCFHMRSAGLGWLRRFVAWLKCATAVDPEDPELNEQLAKLLNIRRRQCAKSINNAMRVGTSVYCIQVVAQVMFGQVPNQAHVLAYGFTLLLVTIAALFSKVFFIARTYPLLHVAVMAMLCILALTEDASNWSPLYLAMHACSALIVGGMYLCFKVVALTNTVLLGCYLVVHFNSENSAGDQALSRSVGGELFIWCVDLVLLYSAEALLKFGARKEIEARFGKCQQSAVSSLLDMMCDAVLDLDHEMQFKSHFAKLSNMLMHGNGRSLQGLTLSTFIGDRSDKEAYEDALRQSRDGTNTKPTMLNLRLRDAIGNKVKVALYHVPYTSISGGTHHIIGLREENESWRPGEDLVETKSLPKAVLRPDIAEGLGSTPPPRPPVALGRRSSTSSNCSSRSSRSSRSTQRMCEWEGPEWSMSARVTVDDGIPTKWMGQKLREKLGLDKDAACQVGDFLADGGRALRCWMETNLNLAISRGMDTPFTLRFDEVSLVADGGSGETLVSGMVFGQFAPPFGAGDEPDEVMLGWSKGQCAPPQTPAGRGTAPTTNPQSLKPASSPDARDRPHVSL